MTPIRTILAPTDYSPLADAALQYAVALARDYKARLVVLHVGQRPPTGAGGAIVAAPDPEEYGREELLRELRERPAVGAEVERLLEFADTAANGILQAAQNLNADLIVMGTHGRTGLTRLLMGSVAEEVVRRAQCPVLTVRPANK